MNRRKVKAQAVTELAIFGAILIFVVGSILRNSVDAGMTQNQSLKAMRWVMLQSLYGVRNVNKSRDSASVIFVEDRLAPDAGKVGAIDRAPLIQSASASFTNTLFMPLDWLEYHNVPVTDLFVNGKHFTLSAGNFIVYDVRLDPSDPNQVRVWDLTNDIVTLYPKNGNWKDNCSGTAGCPLFYFLVASNSLKFCQTICTDNTITLDQRFDLNRNNDYSDDPAGAARTRVTWQWNAFEGLKSVMDGSEELKIDAEEGQYPSFDMDGDRKDEAIFAVNPQTLWNKTGASYDVQQGAQPLVSPSIDMAALEAASADTDVVQQLYVLDNQKGDVDSSMDDTDLIASGQSVFNRGLLRSVSVYTETKDGTYLEINEGQAFVPAYGGGQFVRSTSKKDQVDIIARVFQLDNNSGRYCGTVSNTRWDTIGNEPGGLPNPVEYCVDTDLFPGINCFTPVTISATCYDAGTNTIFIRSRIQDQSGRRWATQVK